MKTIYDILDDYQLTNPNNLTQRLDQFSNEDWKRFADDLDNYIMSLPEPELDNRIITPLSFNFPSLPPKELNNIYPYLVVADKTYIDDPLSALVFSLEMLEEQEGLDLDNDLLEAVEDTWKFLLPNRPVNPAEIANEAWFYKRILNKFYFQKKLMIFEDIKEVIIFYLRCKDLIIEGRLIPYGIKTISSDSFSPSAKNLSTFYLNNRIRKLTGFPSDLSLRTYLKARYLYFRFIKRQSNLDSISNTIPFDEIFYNYNLLSVLITSMIMNLAYPGRYGLSTDLCTSDNIYIYRLAIDAINRINHSTQVADRLKTPSYISPLSIPIPMLQNVPPERICDVIEKEPDAFENFRGYCNELLLQITAPPGDPDRDRQILSINQTLTNEAKKLNLVYREIKQSFNKNFTTNLVIGSASILIAGLSVIGNNLDLLSTAGKVLAGGGLAASITGFSKEWLDYQREIQKLKINQNYFIWKLLSKK